MEFRFDIDKWGGEGKHWERIRTVMRHEEPDCIPITMWRHFPEVEDDIERSARVHLAFQMRFNLDLIVYTPPFAFTAWPWGYEMGEDRDGYGRPVEPERPFEEMELWPRLREVGSETEIFAHYLKTLRLIRRNAQDMPVLATVYGPLTTAYFLRGDSIREDVKIVGEDGDEKGALHNGLADAYETIENSLSDFYREVLDIADGLYYISYFGGHDVIEDEELLRVARDYDLDPVHSLTEAEKLLGLHIHGEEILYDETLDYPFDMYNWHDRWVKPSMRDARMKNDDLLMGGINEGDTLHNETPVAVSLQVDDAVNQVNADGLIISAGGPIHLDTPEENIRAAIEALRGEE